MNDDVKLILKTLGLPVLALLVSSLLLVFGVKYYESKQQSQQICISETALRGCEKAAAEIERQLRNCEHRENQYIDRLLGE